MAMAFFILGLCYIISFMIIPGGIMFYLAILFSDMSTKLENKEVIYNGANSKCQY